MLRISLERMCRRPSLLLLLVIAGCADPNTRSELPKSASPVETDRPLWYERFRRLDVTGDGITDSLSLTAFGAHHDSLSIVLTFVSKGREVFRQEWGSSYELIDPPFPDSSPSSVVESFLRARFDTVLARIAVHPFDASSLEKPWTETEPACEEDIRSCIAWTLRDATVKVDWVTVHRDSIGVALQRLDQMPFDTAEVLAIAEDMRQHTRSQVHLSFGYESMMVVAWSNRAQRFFTLFECC
jgi:hypothetical protein